jgi:proteasome lid subunit RPN8/RPN11
MGRSVRTLLPGGFAALLVWGTACGARSAEERGPVVVLRQAARDSMSAAFARSNEHWNELADLNTMERMLGTIRPTQREYLGCLQGQVNGEAVEIDGWVPARDMKQLQLAVAGSCDSVPRLVGTWHTHPFRADLRNLPVKERRLSTQDLQTFGGSRFRVTLVMWDHDSIDAALRTRSGATLHPARVVVR